jgi:ribosomal protein S8E
MGGRQSRKMSERVKKKNELLGLPTPSSFIMSGRSFRLDRQPQPHPVPASKRRGIIKRSCCQTGREVEKDTTECQAGHD